MKKKVFVQSLLILLPVLSVGLATTQDSVTVFDTVSGLTQHYSYFDLVPVSNLQMLPPLAALCSAVSGILAAVYLVKKNPGFLKASGYAAIASASVASILTVMREAVLVIPNVGLPIFMVIHFFCCRTLPKLVAAEKPEKAKNKRLPNRR